jgi:electron transfer flavoprotein beta subunit
MRILVAVKRVPITGGRIVLTDDAQAIDTRHLGFTVSPHEECAAEEAVRLVEAGVASAATVLGLGPPEAEEQLRDALAIGVDDAVHLVTGGEEWDPQASAAAIADVARAAEPAYDLLLFGNESADSGNFQIGARVAYALGLPWVTGVKALTIADSHVRCEVEVPGGRDVYRLPLPAAVGVLEGLNLPRYPSVPGRLRAKRKPLAASSPARPPSRLEKLALRVPPGSGKQVQILGEGGDAAGAVVAVLAELGVL